MDHFEEYNIDFHNHSVHLNHLVIQNLLFLVQYNYLMQQKNYRCNLQL